MADRHINGIESFRACSQLRLGRFKGLPELRLHLTVFLDGFGLVALENLWIIFYRLKRDGLKTLGFTLNPSGIQVTGPRQTGINRSPSGLYWYSVS